MVEIAISITAYAIAFMAFTVGLAFLYEGFEYFIKLYRIFKQ